jgi:DNA-binding SARP family transcriptional activator
VIWTTGPAGSGKTTLVSSYLDANKLPCLWYQVDEGDSDLATFFSYMGMAAKKAAPRKRTPLPLLTPEYLQGIPTFTLRYFENLFSRLKIPFVLVFDNYHSVPADSNFHNMISDGLNTIPDGMNAIIISRHDLPSALSRLHANGLMGMLGWDELRLTLEESGGIVRLKKKGKTPKEMIRRLHDAADGWAAGLVLMLESLKRGIEPYLHVKLTPAEIVDYFGSEFFNKTDKEMQDFLLRTAFLPRITAKMAEKLTGLLNADRILSTLSRNNYFTEKHYSAEPVYQYHPLFREFLLQRAKETFSSELSILLRRTAILLEEAGQPDDAISLFRDLGDWEAMARLIMKQAPSMLEQGRYRPLKEWLDSLPKEVFENDPWLLYWMGICRLPVFPPESQPYFEEAYQRFKSRGDVAGIIQACWGMVYSIIGMAADFTPLDRWISVLEALGRTVKEFPSEEIELRFASAMFCALVNRQPEHPEIEIWANRALSLAGRSSNLTLKFQTIAMEARLQVCIGDFAKSLLAIDSLRKMVQSREPSPLNQILLGALEAMFNNFAGFPEKCLKAVSDGMGLSRTTGIHTLDSFILYQGVESALRLSDYERASTWLEEMGSSLNPARPWHTCLYHCAKTREAFFLGDVGQAAFHMELATKLWNEAGVTLIAGRFHIENAYVMHALGRHREAAGYLARAVDFGRRVRGPNHEYAALLAEALFAFDQGEEEPGLVLLRKSFALGKEKGYFGTWGPPTSGMAKLCIKALQAGIEVEYVQELIRRLHVVPDQPPIHLENWPWPLKVFTLGRFELLKDGKPVQSSRKTQQKPLSLLKALIAFGGREVKEERIADILWPEADGDQAHSAFATTLWRLRQLIGSEKAIEFHEGKGSLNPRYCWIDSWAFERIFEQIEAESKRTVEDETRGYGEDERVLQLIVKAINMYQGHFLADESEEYWKTSYRERLRNKYLLLITRLGHYLQRIDQWEKAVESYQRGLEIDNLAEEFYQHLMICYRHLGQHARAIEVYKLCRKMLSSVLGIDPSPKTEAIHKALVENTRVKT